MYRNYQLGIFEGIHISKEFNPQLHHVFEWLRTEAASGNPKALANLGVMHAMGLGIPLDIETSFDCFQQARTLDDPLGMFNCGVAHFRGSSAPYDPELSMLLFHQAAAAGYIPALLAMASWHLDPARFSWDEKEALKAYQQAAELGSAEGIFQLGKCYQDAIGTRRNLKRSIELFTEAAHMNHLGAQITLRNYYCHKSPDRITKHWKPRPYPDKETSIMWNFVLYNAHQITHDSFAYLLLPYAHKLHLTYPDIGQDLGLQRFCNDIFRAIEAHQTEQNRIYIESRRWAEASGITELYPEHIKNQDETKKLRGNPIASPFTNDQNVSA